MEKRIRELIVDPSISKNLKVVIPELHIQTKRNGEIIVPAELESNGNAFIFTAFSERFLKDAVWQIFGVHARDMTGHIFTKVDSISISGYLQGRVYFECHDVWSQNFGTITFPGISSIGLIARKLSLVERTQESKPVDKKERPDQFRAHAIFHGPKLNIFNGVTKTIFSNDFLKETSKQDTCCFEGDVWEAALIQEARELHLHARLKEGAQLPGNAKQLFQSIMDAVGFTHGFKPWPLYYSFWSTVDGSERWICPQFKLKQCSSRPITDRNWMKPLGNSKSEIFQCIPIIAKGLHALPEPSRKRLMLLLWNVNEVSTGQLPDSTQMLMLCSALDGLMRIVAGMEDGANKTTEVWKKGAEALGFNWDGWIQEIFELRPKHRHDLAHGRLWHMQEVDKEAYFKHYPKLGAAFSAIFCRFCGYDGPLSDENYNEVIIRDLMESQDE